MRGACGSRAGEDAGGGGAGGGWRAAQGRRLRESDCLGCESWPLPPPETPPSSHLKPALGHSVHVPPHGASGCGPGRALRRAECKDRGQGRPRSSGSGRRRRQGSARPPDAEERPLESRGGLHHRPRRPRPRRLPVASSVLSKASTSTQNKNTPHLPATPLLIGQSRPGLRNAGGGEERSAASGGGGGASPPLPHPAQPRTVSRRAPPERGVTRARAHQDKPRQGERPSARLPPRACARARVHGGPRGARRGGCERARARGRARRAEQGRDVTGFPSSTARTHWHVPELSA